MASQFLGGIADPGAQAVVLKVFGTDLGTKLATLLGHGKKDWRKVLEPKEPTAQCDNSVGAFDREHNKLCYLCGHVIPDKKGRSSQHPLFAECEHILPVTSARWFLTLYMNKEQTKDPWVKTILTYEYAWAHRICNQTKSNELFVVKNERNQAVVATNTLANVLERIKSAAKRYRDRSSEFLKDPADRAVVDGIVNMDVRTRVAQIANVKLTPIVNHINSYPAEESALVDLTRAAFLMDTSTMTKAAKDFAEAHYKSTVDTYTANRVGEIQAEIPAIFKESLPKYEQKTLLATLTLPISTSKVSFPETTESAVQAAYVAGIKELNTFVRGLETNAAASILASFRDTPTERAPVYDVQSVHSLVSLFQYRLYSAMWTSIDAGWKRKNKQVTCNLWNILLVTHANAIRYPPIAATPAPTIDPETKALCDKEDEKRTKAADLLKSRIDNLSERLWEKEEPAEPTPADMLVEFAQGPYTEPEVFLKQGSAEARAVILTGTRVDLVGEIGELRTRYEELLAKKARTPAENEEIKRLDAKRISLLTRVQDIDTQLASIRKGGRRIKRSKTFRRTKGGRRSGPSTKSRRRPFRKHPTGTTTTRTRY